MNSNTVLDDAERRMGTAGKTRKDREAAEVEAMRRDIGVDLYEKANRALPDIERAINTIYRPFLDRTLALAQTTGAAPLPIYVRDALAAMANLAYTAPLQIKAGLKAYLALSFQQIQWKDEVEVYDYARKIVVGDTRSILMTHDGVLSALEREKGKVEQYMRESGWPAGSVQEPGIMTAGAQPGRPAATRELTVDSEFSLG